MNDDIIKAVCAAVVLGEGENYEPVHLEPREARQAIAAYHAALATQCSTVAITDGVVATPAPSDRKVAPVTREDAVGFLEIACRNWSRMPKLSEDDIGDVATTLLWFSSKRAALATEGSKG